jgi:carbonic anhydrase/acetyltransferase-like protein (isoleucine patch superfamily)
MPAKVVRPVAKEDLERIRAANEAYQRLMRMHKG